MKPNSILGMLGSVLVLAFVLYCAIQIQNRSDKSDILDESRLTLKLFEISQNMYKKHGVYLEILLSKKSTSDTTDLFEAKEGNVMAELTLVPHLSNEQIELFKEDGGGNVLQSELLKAILQEAITGINTVYPNVNQEFKVMARELPDRFDLKMTKLNMQARALRKRLDTRHWGFFVCLLSGFLGGIVFMFFLPRQSGKAPPASPFS